ncbi:MAG: hypothetical protein JWQ97_986 [Phenylobacterium sp.]|nr:hypothetical protein [Phenylobacterium sp.]
MDDIRPQFTPGSRGHHALAFLSARCVQVTMTDMRSALGVNPGSKKAKSKLWRALFALEENGFLTREAHPDEPRYCLTEAGLHALVDLDQGLEVFGLPYHERSRPPRCAPSVRLFARAA